MDKKHECEGNCEEHVGKVMWVRVMDLSNGTDWGNFYYCQTAIEDDRRDGLLVVEEPECVGEF
jgi:hypothetical protein